jgi:hypothetical protein
MTHLQAWQATFSRSDQSLLISTSPQLFSSGWCWNSAVLDENCKRQCIKEGSGLWLSLVRAYSHANITVSTCRSYISRDIWWCKYVGRAPFNWRDIELEQENRDMPISRCPKQNYIEEKGDAWLILFNKHALTSTEATANSFCSGRGISHFLLELRPFHLATSA